MWQEHPIVDQRRSIFYLSVYSFYILILGFHHWSHLWSPTYINYTVSTATPQLSCWGCFLSSLLFTCFFLLVGVPGISSLFFKLKDEDIAWNTCDLHVVEWEHYISSLQSLAVSGGLPPYAPVSWCILPSSEALQTNIQQTTIGGQAVWGCLGNRVWDNMRQPKAVIDTNIRIHWNLSFGECARVRASWTSGIQNLASSLCDIFEQNSLKWQRKELLLTLLKSQPSVASKGTYSQVGFAYEGDGKEECQLLESDEEEEDEDDKDISSDDSEDEEIETIAKEYGVKRFNWLVYMDRKAKEEEKRQKEVAKGDPAMRKLSRKERRKASQQEREKEKEAARMAGSRLSYHDPYREPRRSPTYEAYSRSRISRSRSRSRSPSYSRRYDRGRDDNSRRRSKGRDSTSKIEYITEFGGAMDRDDHNLEGVAPPPSPPSQADLLNRQEFGWCWGRLGLRAHNLIAVVSSLESQELSKPALCGIVDGWPSSGRILEALHIDPAVSVTPDWERAYKESKPSVRYFAAGKKLVFIFFVPAYAFIF
eukprot:Gb_10092 [translate_table: standard]